MGSMGEGSGGSSRQGAAAAAAAGECSQERPKDASASASAAGACSQERPEETAEQAFTCLNKMRNKGTAAYWKDLEPVLVARMVKAKEVKVCKLKCVRAEGACGKLLGITNPARSAGDHFTVKGCRAVRQEQGQENLQQVLGKRALDTPTSSSNKQPRITQHMVSSQQLKEARNHLARFFFKSGCALRLVEHPDLLLALNCLGMSKAAMPTAKVGCGG